VGAICTFLFGFCAGPIFPVAITLAQQRFPEAGGTIAGLLMSVGNLGVIAIPWLQGQVGRGESGGMQVTLIATLIVAALAVLIARNGRSVSAI
jgi:fucose permease